MVDEYQDTNAAQYQIVLALSQRFPNLCVTGDPDQSIYGWRGARIANILRFEKDFPSAKLIRLEENFRSSPEVLAAADSLIAHNTQRKEKHLIATQPSGPPVKGLLYENGNDEADGIAGRIRLAIDDGNWRPSDVAIFYRTNALSRQVELALQRMKVPYQIAAGVAFYERAEIKDAVAYLRLIANPRDRAAFIRVVNKPLRGLGETSRNRLLAWADREGLAPLEACLRAKEVGKINAKAVFSFKIFAELIKSLSLADSGSVADLLDTVLEKSKYRMALAMSPHEEDHERLQNLDELISAARQYDDQAGDERTLEGFLEQVSLVSETDSLDSSAGSVTLMTLHAAKGLEFPVVFIIGVEEGLLPHERAIKDESRNAIEEERRLMFVGMTRAKRELLLTHTAVRAIRGRLLTSIPSLFLSEFPHQQELQESVYGVGRAFKMPTWDPDDDVIDVSKEGFETSEETEEPEVVFNPPRRKGVLAKGLAPITEYLDEEEEGSGQWAVGSGETVAVPSAPSLPKDQGPGTKNSPRERKKKSPPVLPTLTTAASLLSGKTETVDIPIGFQPGMQVRHPRYGLGQVLQTGHIASRRTVTVMFEEDGRVETFVASKCPLQPVGL
jgi:DNA helicase-2/ATP-dependent DNA helicase PcrA